MTALGASYAFFHGIAAGECGAVIPGLDRAARTYTSRIAGLGGVTARLALPLEVERTLPRGAECGGEPRGGGRKSPVGAAPARGARHLDTREAPQPIEQGTTTPLANSWTGTGQ